MDVGAWRNTVPSHCIYTRYHHGRHHLHGRHHHRQHHHHHPHHWSGYNANREIIITLSDMQSEVLQVKMERSVDNWYSIHYVQYL